MVNAGEIGGVLDLILQRLAKTASAPWLGLCVVLSRLCADSVVLARLRDRAAGEIDKSYFGRRMRNWSMMRPITISSPFGW